MNRLSKILLWISNFVIIIFFAFISFMSLSEWWNIKIIKEIDKYSWGPVNENSWYYETPNLYANVSLIEGLLMLILVSMSTVEIVKKNTNYKYWLICCLALFIWMIISSNIR